MEKVTYTRIIRSPTGERAGTCGHNHHSKAAALKCKHNITAAGHSAEVRRFVNGVEAQ